jgi:hypothetical protein
MQMKIINSKNLEAELKIEDGQLKNKLGFENRLHFNCAKCGCETIMMLRSLRRRNKDIIIADLLCVKCYAKKVNMDKYGVENQFQRSEIIEKITKDKDCTKIREKAKITCMEKYGVPYALQAKEVREKIEKTCMEKYGAKAVIARPNAGLIYGFDNPMFKEENRETLKNTIRNKYGVDYTGASKDVTEKRIQTRLKKN